MQLLIDLKGKRINLCSTIFPGSNIPFAMGSLPRLSFA
jgi:hypothetical protein